MNTIEQLVQDQARVIAELTNRVTALEERVATDDRLRQERNERIAATVGG